MAPQRFSALLLLSLVTAIKAENPVYLTVYAESG
jgi:hypothetical protein